MSFCKNCGNRLSKNANFCDVCGTPARDSSPQSDYRNNADIPAKQSNNYFNNDFNAAPETEDNETFFQNSQYQFDSEEDTRFFAKIISKFENNKLFAAALIILSIVLIGAVAFSAVHFLPGIASKQEDSPLNTEAESEKADKKPKKSRAARNSEEFTEAEDSSEALPPSSTAPETEAETSAAMQTEPATLQQPQPAAPQQPQPANYKTMYVVNCSKNITLRSSPSTKAAAIRQIPLGSPVSYIGTAENGFYKITYLNDTGYALASYLSETNSGGSPAYSYSSPSYTKTMYVVNCSESITLRTSPSTKASAIRQIPLGEPVSYLESAGNGFYKVVYLGSTGYALASYLSEADPGVYSNYEQYYPETLYVVNCKEWITLRAAPSTSAAEVCKIPLGAAVTYVSTAENGFYQVYYNEWEGYALAYYLR